MSDVKICERFKKTLFNATNRKILEREEGNDKKMTELKDLRVNISRDVETVRYPFTQYFQGFDKVEAVKKLFGEKTAEVLQTLKAEFCSSKFGYMGVSDEDGHLLISAHHLRNADSLVLYLDLVHDLHHVKQFFDGRELFSQEYEYVDNPI
jgi:hypothetical protein